MRNFHVGTITGIPIRVNVTLLLFLPVLAWLIGGEVQLGAYASLINGLPGPETNVGDLRTGNISWLVGALGALGLFVSVLVHELGHSWTAMRYDIDIASITLWIFGGMAHMKDLPEEWDKEFWIALAGPVTSVLLGVFFLAVLAVLPAGSSVLVFLVGFLGVVNVTLAVFNMLPAFPMDGGRIFRALLARNRPYVDATRTAATVGKGFAILMAVVGAFGRGFLLVLIALFIYVAASAESRVTQLKANLEGITVRDLMTPVDGRTVRSDQTVADLVDRMLTDRLSAYPVVGGDDRLVGSVSLGSLGGVAGGDRASTTIGDVMGDAVTVSQDDDAFDALVKLGDTRDEPLVVTEDGRVVGLVTPADVSRALEVLQGLGGRRDPDLVPDGYA